MFQQYLNLGIAKCYIYACRDGGLVWGRMHFAAVYQSEMKVILEIAKPKLTEKQFNAVERIYNNYYTKNPRGQEFPINKWAELPFMEKILRNSIWHGVLDLQNRQQLANFISYVS